MYHTQHFCKEMLNKWRKYEKTNDQVEHAEIIAQSVSDENHATVDQISQFEIHRFESGQMLAGLMRVEIGWLDATEFGQIVHHLKAQQSH